MAASNRFRQHTANFGISAGNDTDGAYARRLIADASLQPHQEVRIQAREPDRSGGQCAESRVVGEACDRWGSKSKPVAIGDVNEA